MNANRVCDFVQQWQTYNELLEREFKDITKNALVLCSQFVSVLEGWRGNTLREAITFDTDWSTPSPIPTRMACSGLITNKIISTVTLIIQTTINRYCISSTTIP